MNSTEPWSSRDFQYFFCSKDSFMLGRGILIFLNYTTGYVNTHKYFFYFKKDSTPFINHIGSLEIEIEDRVSYLNF